MNKKKNTILKRKTSTFLLVLSIFYIFGCAPKQIPEAIIPPTPKQTESALVNVKKSKVDVDKTIDNSNRIGVKIDETKKTVLEQKISILEALAQAEKIKEKSLSKIAVTELEAINLIDELKKVENRNLFLEQQNNELFGLRDEQAHILKVIKETLDKTEYQVISKDEEVRQLREQNIYLKQNLTEKFKESEILKQQLQKEKQKSASATVYRNWCIGISIVALLLGAGYVLIRTYIPKI